jgi:hypothetical protein
MLFGSPGKVTHQAGAVLVTGVTGPSGGQKTLSILLPTANKIKSLKINGLVTKFEQKGNLVTAELSFAGARFEQAQQIGTYDPTFAGQKVEGTFTVPKRIFEQLAARRKAWPVPYTEDDRVAPWADPSRLLLYVQIAAPFESSERKVMRDGKEVVIKKGTPIRKDRVTIEIDGKAVEQKEGYNGVYPYVPRSAMGMYADVSSLAPDVPHRVVVTLPEGLKPGQFQGLFFEHVEDQFTGEIKR